MSLINWLNWTEQTNSEKIVLCEIDIGREATSWCNYRPGTWAFTFNTYKENVLHSLGHGNLGRSDLGIGGTYASGNAVHPLIIGSTSVDGTEYTEQGSAGSVQANVESWYYNYDSSKFYIHCTDHDDPSPSKIVILGYILGISNKAIHINNAYYEPLLLGIPALTKTKDPLRFGIIKFDGGQLQFDNSEGYFDNITDNYIFGQQVIVKYGGNYLANTMAYADYQTIFKGYSEGSLHSYNEFELSVADKKKKLSRKIPTSKYEKTTYTDLNADDIGKPIPAVWGAFYHALVVCTNKDETGNDWTFQVTDVTNYAQGIASVSAAYLNGIDLVIKSTDLSAGTFVVSAAAYLPASTDKGKKVTCDGGGYKNSSGVMIQNSLDIIKDIVSIYAAITYNSTNYDTLIWAEQDDNAKNSGIFVDDEIEISTAIEQLATSTFGNFIVRDDGKFSFKHTDITADPILTIWKEEYFDSPRIYHDAEEFLSSCKIGYKKDWDKNSYRWYDETTDEGDIYTKYKKYISENIETLLQNSTDASAYATLVMDYMKEVLPIIEVTVPIKYITREVGDIVNFEIERVKKGWLGYVKVEIVGISKNLGLADEKDYIVLQGKMINIYQSNLLFQSPYAINIDKYAINIPEYAITYGRTR